MNLLSFFRRKKTAEPPMPKFNLALPSRILPSNISAKTLMAEWQAAKGVSILLNYDENLCYLLKNGQYAPKTEADLDALLTERAKESIFQLEDEDETFTDGHEPIDHFVTFGSNLTHEIRLVEIPVEEPWQIFRHLPFGGWSECPEAGLLEVFCHRLYLQYGARPAVIGSRSLELVPQHRPIGDEALTLAQQIYWLCPDVIEQGYGSLHKLANCLTNSKVWCLWWDN